MDSTVEELAIKDVPSGQATSISALMLPVQVKESAAQQDAIDVDSIGEVIPSGHAMHSVAPDESLKVPAGQG